VKILSSSAAVKGNETPKPLEAKLLPGRWGSRFLSLKPEDLFTLINKNFLLRLTKEVIFY